jgi:hypothetical protein
LVLDAGTWTSDGSNDYRWQAGRWQEIMLPALNAFSAVEELDISGVDFAAYQLENQDRTNFFVGFHRLKELRLHRCHFGTFQQFAEAFTSPYLRYFSLKNIHVPSMGHVIPPAPSGVEAIEIVFPMANEDILTWLTIGTNISAGLRFVNPEVLDSLRIANYMRAMGPLLKRLSIDIFLSPQAQGFSRTDSSITIRC